MGEWKEAYLDSKDAEPDYGYDAKPTLRQCWGVLDRQGKCENTFMSTVGVYCDDCRRYAEEWRRT